MVNDRLSFNTILYFPAWGKGKPMLILCISKFSQNKELKISSNGLSWTTTGQFLWISSFPFSFSELLILLSLSQFPTRKINFFISSLFPEEGKVFPCVAVNFLLPGFVFFNFGSGCFTWWLWWVPGGRHYSSHIPS
jgi:hypothetical protein